MERLPDYRDWFDCSTKRFKIYSAISLIFLGLALILAFLQARLDSKFGFIRSDGRPYYMYLPSLLIDGDLDFSNQLENRWNQGYQPFKLDQVTLNGTVFNKRPFGVALTLFPAFLAAHGISHGVYALTGMAVFVPDGYSPPYQLVCLIWILYLGLQAIRWLDLYLVREFHFQGGPVFAGILIYWCGTHFTYYYFREPFMAHIVSFFWVMCAVRMLSFFSAQPSPSRGRIWLAIASFSTAMALVCRMSNGFLLFFWLPIFWRFRNLPKRQIMRFLPCLIAAIPPLVFQGLIWFAMSGKVLYPKAEESLHLFSPALWSTLFSSRHGLFWWSPVLLLCIPGWWLLPRQRLRWQTSIPLFLSFLTLWLINSSWRAWWFGDAFGGRSFIEITPWFVLGLASLMEWAWISERRIQYILGFAIPCLIFTWVLMVLYIGGFINRHDFLWKF